MNTVEKNHKERTQRLTAIACRPLARCPKFPDIARRWEDWWRGQAERPLLYVGTALQSDIRQDRAFDLLERSDEWIALRKRQLDSLYLAGEAVPFVRVDIGPVAMNAFLGVPLHFARDENTSWQDVVIEDWDHLPSMTLDTSNHWFRRVLDLCKRLAGELAGQALVCLPDMTGAIDMLSNMRGPDRLCMDLYDNRSAVADTAMKLVDIWESAHIKLYDAILAEGAGVMQWVGAWSNEPMTVPTCDFNALIGERDFRDICLPSLSEQARRAGRCIFHLDGPQAARHADALAADPYITAIQFVPGAGTPSALAQRDMLSRIQRAGKPVLVCCPVDEVEALCDALDPRRLAMVPIGSLTKKEVDRLVHLVERKFSA